MPNKTIKGWGYVYLVATGELVSEGTVIADPLPEGLALLEHPARHDPETHRWNPAIANIEAWTNAARIQTLAAQRDEVEARMVELGATVTRGNRPTM